MLFKSKISISMSGTRGGVRKKVVKKFLKEKSGSETKDQVSKYEYTVEKYDDYSVVLKRPARLNNGFDFKVVTPKIYYKSSDESRRRQSPKHDDVICILKKVKQDYPQQYPVINKCINDIYLFKKYDVAKVKDVFFLDGDRQKKPIQILLLALRWLFIEQDITYWNYSGRKKLMDGLKQNELA